jgi:hypothetical protein
MKIKAFAVATALCIAVSSAHAMRLDNGRILIKRGDPVAKLKRYAGRADHRDQMRVCKKPHSSKCRGEKGWGWRYQYFMENRTWFIDEYNGIIVHMDWTR